MIRVFTIPTPVANVLARALMALVCAIAIQNVALAQDQEGDIPPFEQIKLTDAHIKGYLGAAPRLTALFDEVDKAGGEPSQAQQKELDELSSKHGFKSFDEMELVVTNISFVMSGLEDAKAKFVEPIESLKLELADAKADTSMKKDDREELIKSLEDSIKLTPKLKFPENVETVRKHFDALAKLFE